MGTNGRIHMRYVHQMPPMLRPVLMVTPMSILKSMKNISENKISVASVPGKCPRFAFGGCFFLSLFVKSC